MKSMEAVDEVDRCICQLEFIRDAVAADLEISEKGSSGFVFILDDIIGRLDKASEFEKATGNGKEEKAPEQPSQEDTDAFKQE